MIQKTRSLDTAAAKGVAVLLAFGLLATTVAVAEPVAQTAETQAKITPDKALLILQQGNERFVEGKMKDHDLMAQVEATSTGQYPHSVVLGCIDSRVPPELVFDQGVGDIFTPRIAGNFANTDIIGSMEFATKLAGSKLIVVLGHTACGAVKGAVDGAQLDNLTHLLAQLAPAVYAVDGVDGPRSSKNSKLVDAVVRKNVEMTVDRILRNSDVISGLVDEGKLKVVGAVHDISTGKVTFLN